MTDPGRRLAVAAAIALAAGLLACSGQVGCVRPAAVGPVELASPEPPPDAPFEGRAEADGGAAEADASGEAPPQVCPEPRRTEERAAPGADADLSPEARSLAEAARSLVVREEPASPGEVPRGARWQRVGRLEVAYGPSGRQLWLRGEEVERVELIGPDLPAGARLLVATDLDVLGPGFLPTDFVVAVPGSERAFPVARVPFDEPAGHPFERAPRARGKVLTDAEALAATVSVRMLKTCPSRTEYCLLYGPAADVAAARDPVEPPGGWFLKSVAAFSAPEDARWQAHPIGRRPDFSEGTYVSELERVGETDGVTVEAERADFAVEGCPWRAFRLWLVVDGRREHALDLGVPGAFALGFSAVLYGDEGRLAVWTGTDALARSLSVHDRRTGARTGPPAHVEAVPYHNICLAGDDGISLEVVMRDGAPGFALSFEGREREALYFEQPDRPGRTVGVRLPRAFVPRESWIVLLRQRGATLHAEVRSWD